MGFRSLILSVICLMLAVGALVWCLLSGWYWPAGGAGAVTAVLVYRVLSIYGSNVRKLNYLLSAFENGDLSFHFAENSTFLQDRVFNILLNRVRDFVSEQQRLRDQNEVFHRAVENLSRTGLLGVGPAGEVRCCNRALTSVLGLGVIRHISDLDRLMPGLTARIEAIEEGGTLEVPIGSEMRIYNFEIGKYTVMDGNTPVRVYVFEEKAESRTEAERSESAQWQKMTRIISHEVLNTITPIVSLSDTLHDMTVLSPLLPGVEELGGRVDIALEDEDMVLFADEQLMRQVVANILKNALNALRDRFKDGAAAADVPLIRITAFVNASDNTEIHISNNGDPIPDENADHIFDPFFTTRAEGTGVGLALSRQIMRAHAGSIRLDRTDPALTTFVLTL